MKHFIGKPHTISHRNEQTLALGDASPPCSSVCLYKQWSHQIFIPSVPTAVVSQVVDEPTSDRNVQAGQQKNFKSIYAADAGGCNKKF